MERVCTSDRRDCRVTKLKRVSIHLVSVSSRRVCGLVEKNEGPSFNFRENRRRKSFFLFLLTISPLNFSHFSSSKSSSLTPSSLDKTIGREGGGVGARGGEALEEGGSLEGGDNNEGGEEVGALKEGGDGEKPKGGGGDTNEGGGGGEALKEGGGGGEALKEGGGGGPERGEKGWIGEEGGKPMKGEGREGEVGKLEES